MTWKQKLAAFGLAVLLAFGSGVYVGSSNRMPTFSPKHARTVHLISLSSGQMMTIHTPAQKGLPAYLELLDKARHSVYIAAYGFTEPSIVDKVIELKNKGVAVKILLDRSQSRGKYQLEAVERLRQANVEFVVGTSPSRGQIMHNKFTIVDDEWVQDGSWNYTRSADYQGNILNFTRSQERAKEFLEDWNWLHSFMSRQSQELVPSQSRR